MSAATDSDPRRQERTEEAADDVRGVGEIPEDPGSTQAAGTPPLGGDVTPEESTTTPAADDDVGAPPPETSGEQERGEP